MHFGIKTNPQHTTWDRMLATWQRVEATEVFDSAWVFDHFYPIKGDPNGPCLEAWTSLTALAQATQRIQIGTMVLGMPYRHPAVLANMAATLDIISGGRLQLGLGAGWNEPESAAYGISLGEDLTERFDRFDEGVEIVVRMLRDEEATVEGTYFTVRKARNEPKGPQRPHPPIVIGGKGEKRTLRTVARWANHWNCSATEPDEWERKVAVLERHCGEVGRDAAEIMKSTSARFDPDNPAQLTSKLKILSDTGLDGVIINLPNTYPHEPHHVDMVAEAISRV